MVFPAEVFGILIVDGLCSGRIRRATKFTGVVECSGSGGYLLSNTPKRWVWQTDPYLAPTLPY